MFLRLMAVAGLCGALAATARAPGQSAAERPDDVFEVEWRAPATQPAGQADLARVEKLIIEQTNEFRKEQGRAPLGTSPELNDTAGYFAGYMARHDRYGHDADGRQPAERAAAHDYDYCIVLENIAWQFRSTGFTTERLAQNLVEGWRKSPGHRKNMLDPDVTETGVAVARSEESGKYYAVQLFGRPKSAQVQFKVSNRADSTINYRLGEKSFTLRPRYIRTHRVCRQRPLAFDFPGQKPPTTRPGPTTQPDQAGASGPGFRPRDGDHYVVLQDDAGRYRVERQ